MSEADIQKAELMEEIHRLCNKLHHMYGIPVMDINAFMLGMVTKSLESEIGSIEARDYIESAMNNVWPKTVKKWRRLLKIFLISK